MTVYLVKSIKINAYISGSLFEPLLKVTMIKIDKTIFVKTTLTIEAIIDFTK